MTIPAGWYPDTQSQAHGALRYWDGEQWTEHRNQPIPAPPTQPWSQNPASATSASTSTSWLNRSIVGIPTWAAVLVGTIAVGLLLLVVGGAVQPGPGYDWGHEYARSGEGETIADGQGYCMAGAETLATTSGYDNWYRNCMRGYRDGLK